MKDPNAIETLHKIEHEPLWDRAHAQLREALLAGRFEPGSRLTLRFLAETFGTSVTPVRDAVSRLVAQGVLKQGPRNSAIVPNVGGEELRHLTIVRSELEGRAAFEAAQNSYAGAVKNLEETLRLMEKLLTSGQLQTYLDIHRQFHFGIYAAAGIPLLSDMIENLWLRCGPVLSFVIPEYVRFLKGMDHHSAALEAIRNREGDKARAEITADIEGAADYLIGLVDDYGHIHRP